MAKSIWMSNDDEQIVEETLYSLRLREWSSKDIPVMTLSSEWEKSILDLIPNRLKRQHPLRVEKTLEEIRDIYEKDMRNFAVRSIVRSAVKNPSSDTLHHYDQRHQQDRCDVLQKRRIFAKKYFLSHSIMREIVELSKSKLPRLIVDIKELLGAKSTR